MVKMLKGCHLVFLTCLTIVASCSLTVTKTDHQTLDLQTGIYYLLDDDYTCISNTMRNAKIKSWRDSIEVTEKEILLRGDICNDQFEPAALSEIQRLASDNIRFNGENYQYFPNKPKLCEAGWWCPVD